MGRQQQSFEEETERIILVGVMGRHTAEWETQDSLEELAQLVDTAGGEVIHQFIFKQDIPHAGLFIGKGKAESIAEYAQEQGGDVTIVFDDDLSPAQGRNLEQVINAKVIDRTQVILDIFAQHAHTSDGRLQVDLARLEYLLPRLRRMWTHLERQKGGIGLRGGPGEQQIEVDRRRIQQQIVRLRRELTQVRRHRAEIRRGRQRHGWALASLVGYTNAGKSTLINQLTGSDVVTNDQLFVTLDPTTRQIELPNRQLALLTDTVGFIRKLPHHLVEAFKATLEEVIEADLLIHVVDASHPQVDRQIEAVQRVLKELGVHDKPVITALNKIDKPGVEARANNMCRDFEKAVCISARRGQGIEQFRGVLADALHERNVTAYMKIPQAQAKLIAELRACALIHHEVYEQNDIFFSVRVPRRLKGRFEACLIEKEAFEEHLDP
ncbi:MAG: GTPase HflX [Spartobacteria bacterium]|nr:GTPase HflX [Spartobacteria bacterium]